MAQHPYNNQSVHLKAFSPEHLQEAVRGAQFEHYILSRVKCDAWLNRWSMGDFTIDTGRYSFPVRVVGAFPSKKLCLGYMRQITSTTWVNGVTADNHTVEFYPEGTELNYRAAPHGQWVSITFDEPSLQEAAGKYLGHEVNLPWNQVVSFRVPPAQRADLDHMINRIWKHPLSGALMVEPILAAIAELLDGFQRTPFGSVARKYQQRKLVLQRSDDYLRANLARPFDLQALAEATGTTGRTLQRTFLAAYGVTPQEWARCLALHRVRKRLLSPDSQRLTVEGIAHEHGFRHMGRFSAYYRELFGEFPSDTIFSSGWVKSVSKS